MDVDGLFDSALLELLAKPDDTADDTPLEGESRKPLVDLDVVSLVVFDCRDKLRLDSVVRKKRVLDDVVGLILNCFSIVLRSLRSLRFVLLIALNLDIF